MRRRPRRSSSNWTTRPAFRILPCTDRGYWPSAPRAISERLQQAGHLGVAVPFHEARHIIGLVTAARLADDGQRRSKNVGQDERAVARHGSRPLKLRVLRLQPLPAVAARISAAGALRYDPLQ